MVLAGGKGWLTDDFNARLRGLEPGRDVFLPGYVSDAELAWLFQNCFACIYPSLFEGFGMPVLEALGFGSPVLCSQTSSLPEVAGDAAIYFDPLQPESIAQAMKHMLSGDVNRERMIEAAHCQAKRFSWTRSAAAVRELYQQVVKLPKINQNGLSITHGPNGGNPASGILQNATAMVHSTMVRAKQWKPNFPDNSSSAPGRRTPATLEWPRVPGGESRDVSSFL